MYQYISLVSLILCQNSCKVNQWKVDGALVKSRGLIVEFFIHLEKASSSLTGAYFFKEHLYERIIIKTTCYRLSTEKHTRPSAFRGTRKISKKLSIKVS